MTAVLPSDAGFTSLNAVVFGKGGRGLVPSLPVGGVPVGQVRMPS